MSNLKSLIGIRKGHDILIGLKLSVLSIPYFFRKMTASQQLHSSFKTFAEWPKLCKAIEYHLFGKFGKFFMIYGELNFLDALCEK